MLSINSVHHIAIICTDYTRSKAFYTGILGLSVIRETFRAERNSYKLDLAVNGRYAIELFSFPDPAQRPSRPEATGLRHIAFAVYDLDETVAMLIEKGVMAEPIRTDELTGKRFTFIADPDDLPIEFYEQ